MTQIFADERSREGIARRIRKIKGLLFHVCDKIYNYSNSG